MAPVVSISAAKLEQALKIAQQVEASTGDPGFVYRQASQLLGLVALPEAQIPRLVVFGQQSMGKSTLLDAIIGTPIGHSDRNCATKCPVCIHIHVADGSASCRLDGKAIPVSGLQAAMKSHMDQLGDRISDQELVLDLEMPDSTEMTLVDLPGVVSNTNDPVNQTRKADTENLVRRYVKKNPNDLYMLVKKADDDPANFSLGSLVEELDLKASQVVVVCTRGQSFLESLLRESKSAGMNYICNEIANKTTRFQGAEPGKTFVLELFSLTDDDRSAPLEQKASQMRSQMEAGFAKIQQLLKERAEATKEQDRLEACSRFFDPAFFKRTLAQMLQSRVQHYVARILMMLEKGAQEEDDAIQALEEELSGQEACTIRSVIGDIITTVDTVAENLINGSYCGERATELAKTFGGSLQDNLSEGHDWAKSVYTSEDYPEGDMEKFVQLVHEQRQPQQQEQHQQQYQQQQYYQQQYEQQYPHQPPQSGRTATRSNTPQRQQQQRADSYQQQQPKQQLGNQIKTKTVHWSQFVHLTDWFKGQLRELAIQKFDLNMLQLLHQKGRTEDRSDWEHTVCEILQMNLRRRLLPLIRLIAFAGARSLFRVLDAALSEVAEGREQLDVPFLGFREQPCIKAFFGVVREASQKTCQHLAEQFASELERHALTVSKTVQFDALKEFFDDCADFEKNFLRTSHMANTKAELDREIEELGNRVLLQSSVKAGVIPEEELLRLTSMQFWLLKSGIAMHWSTWFDSHFRGKLRRDGPHRGRRLSTTRDLLLGEMLEAAIAKRDGRWMSEADLASRYGIELPRYRLQQELDDESRSREFLEASCKVLRHLSMAVTDNAFQFLPDISVGTLSQHGLEGSVVMTGSPSRSMLRVKSSRGLFRSAARAL